MQIPELSFVAIGFVVRFARWIPFAALLGVVAGAACRIDHPDPLALAGLIAAGGLAWFFARLLVEIVVVIADTLLPR